MVLQRAILVITQLINAWQRARGEDEWTLHVLFVPPRLLLFTLATMVIPLTHTAGQMLAVGGWSITTLIGACVLLAVVLYALFQALLLYLMTKHADNLGIIYGTMGQFKASPQVGDGAVSSSGQVPGHRWQMILRFPHGQRHEVFSAPEPAGPVADARQAQQKQRGDSQPTVLPSVPTTVSSSAGTPAAATASAVAEAIETSARQPFQAQLAASTHPMQGTRCSRPTSTNCSNGGSSSSSSSWKSVGMGAGAVAERTEPANVLPALFVVATGDATHGEPDQAREMPWALRDDVEPQMSRLTFATVPKTPTGRDALPQAHRGRHTQLQDAINSERSAVELETWADPDETPTDVQAVLQHANSIAQPGDATEAEQLPAQYMSLFGEQVPLSGCGKFEALEHGSARALKRSSMEAREYGSFALERIPAGVMDKLAAWSKSSPEDFLERQDIKYMVPVPQGANTVVIAAETRRSCRDYVSQLHALIACTLMHHSLLVLGTARFMNALPQPCRLCMG